MSVSSHSSEFTDTESIASSDDSYEFFDEINPVEELFKLFDYVLDNPSDEKIQTNFEKLILKRNLNDVLKFMIKYSYTRSKEIFAKSYQVYESTYFVN